MIPGLLGAGCTSVAFELAKRVGLEVVNSERIIREVVSEKRLSYPDLALMARDGEIDLEDLVKSVALDYIDEGNVIIEGRTAFTVLDHPALLKVFLFADKKVRVERVASRRGISLQEASAEVERSDEDRSRLVERLFKKHITDPSLYDIVIDTSNLTFNEVAALIENMFKWRLSIVKK